MAGPRVAQWAYPGRQRTGLPRRPGVDPRRRGRVQGRTVIPLAAAALAKSAAVAAWSGLKSVPWQVWAFAVIVAAFLWYGESRADQREAEIRAEYDLRSEERRVGKECRSRCAP